MHDLSGGHVRVPGERMVVRLERVNTPINPLSLISYICMCAYTGDRR